MKDRLTEAKERQDEFRPKPFWSWNDELTTERLIHEVREMKNAGLGGFFMHARVGLKTPYFGRPWFDAIRACVDEAVKLGMEPWGYDENGYPSGIADQQVVKENENYRSTWIEWIRSEDLEKHPEKTVLAMYRRDGASYVRVRNENEAEFLLIRKSEMRAADPMNRKAVERFIELTHERYKSELGDRFGKGGMPGFFTDEPQLKQYQLPWSDGFEKAFSKVYGYDILDKAYALKFDEVPGHEAVRNDYWALIHTLYTESYAKTVGDWCQAHSVQFTGHVMGEDTILEQMGSTGGVMAFYEYMDVPGMDWLGRRIGSPLAPKQVSSVAAQLGKEKVISETFALSGWDVSFEDLKWMAEWQYANGVNLLCPHLESYSIRGIRKRDYPASLFVQEPWWPVYRNFTDYISSLGSLLSAFKEKPKLLVLHPLRSAHVLYNGSSSCEAVKKLDEAFLKILTALETSKVPYHLGDERILARHGSVSKDGRLTVGNAAYDAVLLPELVNVTDSTASLLKSFTEYGGTVYSAGMLPGLVDGRPSNAVRSLPVTPVTLSEFADALKHLKTVFIEENGQECCDILSSVREGENEAILFVVNTSRTERHDLSIRVNGKQELAKISLPEYRIEPVDYDTTSDGVSFGITLQPAESAVLYLTDDDAARESTNETPMTAKEVPESSMLSLPETLTIASSDPNALTLDSCRYSVNGGPVEGPIPLIILQKKLLDMQLDGQVDLFFTFRCDFSEPRSVSLVSENVPAFRLFVNGAPVEPSTDEYFLDPDFKKTDVTRFLRNGENEIRLSGRFFQRKELYDYLYRPKDLSSNFYAVDFEFESVTYDTELESIYLLGDFSVRSDGAPSYGDRRAVFTDGPFTITDSVRSVRRSSITEQGFWFFAGKMTLTWTETIENIESRQWYLDLPKPDAPAAELSVNGGRPHPAVFGDRRIDVTGELRHGENRFALTLYSGLRNLLGPHHFKFGESYYVGTTTFGNDPGWCEDVVGIREPLWSDRWCFVRFGPQESDKKEI